MGDLIRVENLVKHFSAGGGVLGGPPPLLRRWMVSASRCIMAKRLAW